MEPCVSCIYMCENLHYESVYFKELHNEQEYVLLTDNIQNGGSCSVNYTLFFYKNIVFPGQAEYSYFSADFRL